MLDHRVFGTFLENKNLISLKTLRMETFKLICFLKEKKAEIVSKTPIPKSGYISLWKNKIFYSDNMIEFSGDEMLFELIKY